MSTELFMHAYENEKPPSKSEAFSILNKKNSWYVERDEPEKKNKTQCLSTKCKCRHKRSSWITKFTFDSLK